MTDEELSILIHEAGLVPPVAYTPAWLRDKAQQLVSSLMTPSMAQKVALAAILQRLEVPGVSITYERARRLVDHETRIRALGSKETS